MSNRSPGGHRPEVAPRSFGGPITRRWTALLVVGALVFIGLRTLDAAAEPPTEAAIYTSKVVLVGVTGRYALTPADQEVLGDNLDDLQVGAVSARARKVGECAAAGWTSLGAGRRATAGGLCQVHIADGRVTDWEARQAAAATSNGDAQLGTLAAHLTACVSAVGPGAALAAARPDGSVSSYHTAADFLAQGARPSCPVTLVDAGPLSDQVIAQLAEQQGDVTTLVTGIGPAPGSTDPGLQVFYRLGTTFSGWSTSASTRRRGVITLTDLTRTLIEFERQGDPTVPLPAIDGSPLAVDFAPLTVAETEDHLRAVAALSNAALTGYLGLGLVGFVLVVIMVVGAIRRRFAVTRLILTFAAVLGAAMMLTGSLPWQESRTPGLSLTLLVLAWGVVLTGLALVIARLARVPAVIAAAGLVVAAFTVDAALGGVMQPGSMLNSRPIYGLRWYGFGNVTFAAYAAAGLVLAGYLAHRFLGQGRRAHAVGAVAVIGFGIVICDGWPTMGTDFGGVVALTPVVLWLLLRVSGLRVTWPRLLAVGGGAVAAIVAISLLDWWRGPDARSHLGNFVQRIFDGDALDVVARKATAAAETIIGPLGIGSIIIGVPLWIIMFRWVLPVLRDQFSTVRLVALGALATAILGTLLNDGGVSVWLTLTGAFAITVAWLWVDRAVDDGRLSWAPPRTAPGPRLNQR
jgi:hypothetical protein